MPPNWAGYAHALLRTRIHPSLSCSASPKDEMFEESKSWREDISRAYVILRVVGIEHLSPWRCSVGSWPSKLRTIVGANVWKDHSPIMVGVQLRLFAARSRGGGRSLRPHWFQLTSLSNCRRCSDACLDVRVHPTSGTGKPLGCNSSILSSIASCSRECDSIFTQSIARFVD